MRQGAACSMQQQKANVSEEYSINWRQINVSVTRSNKLLVSKNDLQVAYPLAQGNNTWCSASVLENCS